MSELSSAVTAAWLNASQRSQVGVGMNTSAGRCSVKSFEWSNDCVWICGFYSQLRASFTYFGDLLRCPHKRIVTITKVYIARMGLVLPPCVCLFQEWVWFNHHVFVCSRNGLTTTTKLRNQSAYMNLSTTL